MLTKEYIVQLLKTNDMAVGRALLALNARQTEDERAHETTKHSNGKGFTSAHARVGTSMANFFTKTGFLTAKQLQYWRKTNDNGRMRIEMYASQLLIVAKEKQAQKQLTIPIV